MWSIDERYNGYFIGWYIREEGEYGYYLSTRSQDKEEPSNREDYECWLADRAAAPFADGETDLGCFFETRTTARKALAAVKLAIKVKRDVPEWAETALAAGWKPPKNWKP